ncbi:MAG: hypothetical protein LBR73_06760 [Oscillospiraceae bacterium]|jgi:uroporphyrinogen decarboxylase|nr:hypothetical protein [Oscillospiraceae bacterium]
MTERERFAATLRREKVPGRVPTFELQFFLTMEAVGLVHPHHTSFRQWKQMTDSERSAHLDYRARTFAAFAEKYDHSAVNITDLRVLERFREVCSRELYVTMEIDPTFSMPNGDDMFVFAERLYEDETGLKAEAEKRLADAIRRVEEETLAHPGQIDGILMTADYCFNTNPFFSPAQFEVYVAPYLARFIQACKDCGYQTIKHTDGNIYPILDQLADCQPDALHSIDPQAKVSLAEVSAKYGDRLALCGNVNCGLLQTGTDAEAAADIRRSLRDGMARGYGYVFCTSNCAYTGLPLDRYEMMIDIWRKEGIYA